MDHEELPRSRKIGRGVRSRRYASGLEAYEIQFRYRGITCKEILKNTPVTARNDQLACDTRTAIVQAIDRGTFTYTDYFPNARRARIFGHAVSTATLNDKAAAYLNDVKRSYRPSTARQYGKALTQWILPAIGHLRLADITPDILRALIRDRDVTLKTIRNELTPLRALLDQAVEDHELERNPIDVIKPKRLVDRARRSSYVVDPYARDEIAAIVAAARERRPRWAPYWQFAFYTGMRTSEQFGAVWTNWSRRDAVLRVDRTVVERIEQDETKTKAGERDLLLLPAAQSALLDQWALTGTWSERIFVNPRRQTPLRDYEESQRCLKWLCKLAGVRYRNQYQTRHSFASNLLSDGENPYRVAEMLGHANVDMVMKVYGKWIEKGNLSSRREFISDYGASGADAAVIPLGRSRS